MCAAKAFAGTALVVTPAPPGSRAGNRATARRWAGILRALGWRVAVRTDWDGRDYDLLLALHACKSHAALCAFRRAHPQRRIVLALTGTDIYAAGNADATFRASLALADRLVVLQRAALSALDPAQRRRARVIHQSVATRLTHHPTARTVRVCVLGHLRAEKAPFVAAAALCHLDGAPVQVIQAGKALSPVMAADARRWMRAEPSYRWVGELPHWQTLRLLARSHAMVIGSLMEGGANVVSEAIAIGVPVLASDIPGNRGLLGEAYPGYFPVGDAAALGTLLARAATPGGFLKRLAGAVRRRQHLVAPQREMRAWRDLLGELFRPARGGRLVTGGLPATRAPGRSCADGSR